MQLSVSVPSEGLGRVAPASPRTGRRAKALWLPAPPCTPAEGGLSREREANLPALQGGRSLCPEAHPKAAEGLPQEGPPGSHQTRRAVGHGLHLGRTGRWPGAANPKRGRHLYPRVPGHRGRHQPAGSSGGAGAGPYHPRAG